MASARYWGDEKQEDAVYAVYLRKVRYVPPNNYQGTTHFRPLNPDYGYSNDTDHLQWETVKEKVIKAGTLGKLVEFLILPDGEMDTRHFNVLFNTYRAVSSAFDVLRLILIRYSGLVSDKIQCKNQKHKSKHLDSLRSVLNFWLDMFPEDFVEPPHYPCLLELIEFGRMHSPHLQDIFVKAARWRERCARDALIHGTNNKCYAIEKHSLAMQLESLDYLLSPGRHKVSDPSQADPVVTAEQLTYWDAELFKRLLPYQCQGCFWSRRHRTRKGSEMVHTVKATVDQFNAVSRRVMTSVVFPDCKPGVRAKIICKWIEVAREGTAKSANGLPSVTPLRSGARRHRRAKSDMSEVQGTVPYLGTFLTDLTMIDEALTDKTEEGLINFEKRRKEFDVIAQLKLFQSAARSYHFQMDPKFCNWFQCLPCLPEKDCYRRSFEIEAPTTTPDATPARLKKQSNHIRKSSTLSKIFLSVVGDGDSSSAGEDDWFSVVPPTPTANGNEILPKSPSAGSTLSTISTGKSVFYGPGSEFYPSEFFGGGRSSSGGKPPKIKQFLTPNYMPPKLKTSISASAEVRSSRTSLNSQKGLRYRASSASNSVTPRSIEKLTENNSYILRITLDDELRRDSTEAQKCIRLENGDRLPWLIEKALTKHLISLDNTHPSDYCLVQILDDGREFVLPEKCNPFYAVVAGDTKHKLNFILRRKDAQSNSSVTTAFMKKKKRRKSNLLRWSSGFL